MDWTGYKSEVVVDYSDTEKRGLGSYVSRICILGNTNQLNFFSLFTCAQSLLVRKLGQLIVGHFNQL